MKSKLARRWCRIAVVTTLPLAAGTALPQTQAAPSAAEAQSMIEVTGFNVTGNTLLDPTAISAVLETYKGRHTLEELSRAAREVQRLYTDAGFGGVVAYLPPQTSTDGVVTIAVLEGRIAAVTVKGARLFSEEQVRASVPALETGTTPRLRLIDAQMQMANENPAKHLSVLLKPGQLPGETEAEVSVVEAPLQRFTVTMDDTGNETTGEYRIAATWQHASVSGHDDVLTAYYQTSPSEVDRVNVLSAGYRWPFYRQQLLLDLFAAYSNVDGGTTQTAAGGLQFNGRGRIVGARATRILPRFGAADQRLSMGLDQREYLNDCAIEGQPEGACGPAGESVTVQPLSLEYSVQVNGEVTAGATLTLQYNTLLGGNNSDPASFEAVRPGAEPRYTTFRMGMAGAYSPADGWTLRARLTAQLTNDALVPGEQLGIGGATSVRGYEEREVVGDSGVQASAELTAINLLSGTAALRPFAFLDAGQVSNSDNAPCLGTSTRCSMASYGAGLLFEQGSLYARLALARATKDALTTRSGDSRAHFVIAYTF